MYCVRLVFLPISKLQSLLQLGLQIVEDIHIQTLSISILPYCHCLNFVSVDFCTVRYTSGEANNKG